MVEAMQRGLHLSLGVSLLLILTTLSLHGEIADSPQTIQPILTGSQVPDVSLVGLDGTRVHLPTSVTRQRTVLIFYRGGW